MKSLLLASMLMFAPASIQEFTINSIDGTSVQLSTYKGKIALVVNVASQCGYTPQYEGLEALYKKYKDKGFVILGFPANNFGGQEPGSNAEIKTFCTRKFSVDFPMFSKISVKGSDQAPLYHYLTKTGGGEIQWNFTKFLVDRDGKVIQRFESAVEPGAPEMLKAVEAALAKH
jgi:glutathione peroxidase